jgi:hypothetical protein
MRAACVRTVSLLMISQAASDKRIKAAEHNRDNAVLRRLTNYKIYLLAT